MIGSPSVLSERGEAGKNQPNMISEFDSPDVTNCFWLKPFFPQEENVGDVQFT